MQAEKSPFQEREFPNYITGVKLTKRPLTISIRSISNDNYFIISKNIHTFASNMKHYLRQIFEAVKRWLAGLSFRTGVITLASCIIFYILSFAQMLLPISPTVKGILWVVLFGMAKTTQYMGLAIVGVEGWRRIKGYFKRSKSTQKD